MRLGFASDGGMFTMSTHTFGDDPLLAKYSFDEFQHWDLAINYMDVHNTVILCLVKTRYLHVLDLRFLESPITAIIYSYSSIQLYNFHGKNT